MSKLIAPIRKKGMIISYYSKDGWKVYELKSSTINGKSLKDVFLTKKYNPLIRSPKSGDWYVVSYNFRTNKVKPTKANYKVICNLITMDSDIFRKDIIEAAEIFGLNPQMFGADSWSQFHKRDICKELSKAMVSFTGELFMDTPDIQDPELKVRLTADELGISQKDATEVIKIVKGTGSSESKWRRAMNYLWEHKYSAAAALAFVGALIWGVKSGNLQSLGSYGWEGIKSGASSLWDYAQLQAKYNALGTALGTGVAGVTGAASRLKNRLWGEPAPLPPAIAPEIAGLIEAPKPKFLQEIEDAKREQEHRMKQQEIENERAREEYAAKEAKQKREKMREIWRQQEMTENLKVLGWDPEQEAEKQRQTRAFNIDPQREDYDKAFNWNYNKEGSRLEDVGYKFDDLYYADENKQKQIRQQMGDFDTAHRQWRVEQNKERTNYAQRKEAVRQAIKQAEHDALKASEEARSKIGRRERELLHLDISESTKPWYQYSK